METETKLQPHLRVDEMRDEEIVKLAQVCAAMFSSLNLTSESATAYIYILKNKFPGMKGERIVQRCAEAAAYPPKDGIKFSPSFLATILRGHEKINQTMNHEEHIATQAERYAYRQEFMKDLYADFNDFKNGQKPSRIRVWQYVAELFVRKGFAEAMPKVSERNNLIKLNDLLNQYQPFVFDCFTRIINHDKHVSDYINGLEN